jgi:hypothetical protein
MGWFILFSEICHTWTRAEISMKIMIDEGNRAKIKRDPYNFLAVLHRGYGSLRYQEMHF